MAWTSDEDDEIGKGPRKYRAPALEKGLDVVELLVEAGKPLTMTEICHRLGRSQGEMFRIVQILLVRDMVVQDDASDGYRLTNKLFTLAMGKPPIKSLIETALPCMRNLALEIGQSCHLALHARGEMVVVARMESNEYIGFSVRVGHRASLARSGSGVVLFAFQPEEVQESWLARMAKDHTEAELEGLRKRAVKALKLGYNVRDSDYIECVTDLSVPIMRGGQVAAALTVPFIRHANILMDQEAVIGRLLDAEEKISAQLFDADSRS